MSAIQAAQYYNRTLRYYLAYATFIGIIVHEFAHRFACQIHGVPIQEVVYFDRETASGHVIHDSPHRFRAAFSISVAPLLFNTIVGAGIIWFLAANWPPNSPRSPVVIATYAIGSWIAFSLLYQAFPSRTDARTLWSQTKRFINWRIRYLLILPFIIPIVLTIHLLNLGRPYWADKLFAAAIAGVAIVLALHPGAIQALAFQILEEAFSIIRQFVQDLIAPP